ncbi:MAG: DUF1588 domain-containing protein [Rubripirellula sp.]
MLSLKLPCIRLLVVAVNGLWCFALFAEEGNFESAPAASNKTQLGENAAGIVSDAERGFEMVDFSPPKGVAKTLGKYCGSCHVGESAEQGVRIDQLSSVEKSEGIALLNQLDEQLHFGLMPPEEEDQPTEIERAEITRWIREQLDSFQGSSLEGKLAEPEYGNYLQHEKLFSGEYAHLQGYTQDRRWLISEYIFNAKINRLLNHTPFQTIDGKREWVIGDNNRRVPITNPFLLPSKMGIRYYANETLNAGHLLTMMANAKEIADYMIHLVKRDRRYLPAINAVMGQQWEDERTLLAREDFLKQYMEEILWDIYGAEHKKMLPRFSPVDVAATEVSQDGTVKKAAFHAANPGLTELVTIFKTMQKVERAGQSDESMLEECERVWFNFGDDDRRIQARMTFLRNYLPEFRKQIETHRYEQKYKQRPYQPLSDSEMKAVSSAIRANRQTGDRYIEIINACLAGWSNEFAKRRELMNPINEGLLTQLITELFEKIYERDPQVDELKSYLGVAAEYFDTLANDDAIHKLIETLILRSEFVYRNEYGVGEPDPYGRRRLSPRQASYAIAYALTDSSPDDELRNAAEQGRLETREDYRREVQRLLDRRDQFYVIDEGVQRLQLTASITNQPIRKLRFFREFFGYPALLNIFKDNKRFGGNYDNSKGRLVGEADRLVEHVLQQDQRVFESLLGSENYYVFHSGDNEAMTEASERIRRIYDYFKEYDWKSFEKEDLYAHKTFLEEVKMRGVDVRNLEPGGRRNPIREFKTAMESFTLRFDKGQSAAAPYVSFPAHGPYNASTRTGLQLRSPEVAKFFNIRLDDWDYPAIQPAPVKNRRGMLTHPAWLIAHAKNTETDPIARGKWIREKLLAGTVPDLPITVDAVIPEDHQQTLRQRLEAKTSDGQCWKCHQKMNPLGLPFEIYDDFGRYRLQEELEHPDNRKQKGPDKAAVHVDLRDQYKTLPVNATGYLEGTGDPALDGSVKDALDLVDRLNRSPKVRQSIIRHAFRYFLGRNETLADSKTLMDADQAYVQSGGSFDAVILSLLTSDSFIYRKAVD